MKTKFLMAALLVLSLAACSTMKVTTNAVPGAAESMVGYHTYAWLPQPAQRDANHDPIAEAQIQQAVENNLAAKGFRRVDAADNPDFLVGWHATTQEKTRVEDVNPYYGYGWGPAFGPPIGYGGTGGPAYVTEYEEGTLILDVVDGRSRQLEWRGEAQADLGSDPSGGESRKKIDEATEKILSDFPPRPS